MGPYAERVTSKLTETFKPIRLDVVDESHKHAGHSGARPEGETHFRVTMVSDAFTGKNRIDRQRMVFATLKDELEERIHALALKLRAPDEA